MEMTYFLTGLWICSENFRVAGGRGLRMLDSNFFLVYYQGFSSISHPECWVLSLSAGLGPPKVGRTLQDYHNLSILTDHVIALFAVTNNSSCGPIT
jgi:hypothetical protein